MGKAVVSVWMGRSLSDLQQRESDHPNIPCGLDEKMGKNHVCYSKGQDKNVMTQTSRQGCAVSDGLRTLFILTKSRIL